MSAEPPGVFGIDSLTRKVDELTRDIGAVLRHQSTLLTRIHGLEKYMADQFDGIRQLLDDQDTAIKQEAAQVNAKLDEQLALIQQLQDTINQGGTVPQDLVDKLKANTTEIQGIMPDSLPEPTPAPEPAPGRRR